MKVIIVLGTLHKNIVQELFRTKEGLVFHFSPYEYLIPSCPLTVFRLPNPQLNALGEAEIVERCIDRNIVAVSSLGDDESIMRRALRLSELRIEARCYLNAMEALRSDQFDNDIDSVTFVSRYICAEDVMSDAAMSTSWRYVAHNRLLGAVPGLVHISKWLELTFRQLWK